ncbi:MAG: hypothetical protein PHH30_02550 [Bacteroidales bacterium]|nr:hypothetical protein [Bacteroidales bacterium]
MEPKNNLDTLSTFHYVWGGLKLFASLIVLIYVIIGMGMVIAGQNVGEFEMQLSGWIFIIFGFFTFLLVVALGVLSLLCGRYLKERRNRVFCMVMSALACVNAPLGTVLGIFTILEIEKPEVKKIFEENKAAREAIMRKAGI